MDDKFAQMFAERFDELGLRFQEPVDLTELPDQSTLPITLAHERGRAMYNVAYADTLTASSLNWAMPHSHNKVQLLLLGPRVTERSADMFRQRGINYLDAAGNAFISFGGVHIDVRGRRAQNAAPTSIPRTARGGVNLYS